MVELKHISKSFYLKDKRKVEVLKDVSVLFPSSSLSFILGKSGSGKTTLLDIVGCLLTPDQGEVYINDHKIDYSSNKSLFNARSNLISFVFQDYNLLEDFTIEDNLQIAGLSSQEEVDSLLKKVGLFEKKGTEVRMLSGGEKQRLAIARALGRNTELILLDEPTGNLDKENSKAVMELLKELCKEKTVIVVTHDEDLVKEYGDFACKLEYGEVKVILDNKREEVAAEGKSCNKLAKFDFKHTLKYSLSLLRTKLVSSICLVASFLACLFLVLTSLSLLTFDCTKVMYESLQEEDRYQLSPIVNSWNPVGSGIRFSNELEASGLEYYPYFFASPIKDGETQDDIVLKINVVNGSFKFQNEVFTEPSEGEAYLTSYASDVIGSSNLSFDLSKTVVDESGDALIADFNISKIINVNLDQSIQDKIDSNIEELTDSEKQMFDDVYLNAFISKASYLELTSRISQISLSLRLHAYDSTYRDINIRVSYVNKAAQDTVFSFGKAPEQIGDFAVSTTIVEDLERLINYGKVDKVEVTPQSLLKKNLYYNLNDEDFEDGKKNYVSDLFTSEVYSGTYSLTGVYDSSHLGVYVSPAFFDKYFEVKLNHLDGFTSVINSKNDISSLIDLGYDLNDSNLMQIQYLSEFLSRDLPIILNVFTGLIFVIFVVLLLLSSSLSVNEKSKELAVMKSLGIKVKSIYFSFFLKTAAIGLCSFILAFILSAISVPILNDAVCKMVDIQINVSPVSFQIGYSFLILIGTLVVCFIGTLMPSIKIKKIDIATQLKMN